MKYLAIKAGKVEGEVGIRLGKGGVAIDMNIRTPEQPLCIQALFAKTWPNVTLLFYFSIISPLFIQQGFL